MKTQILPNGILTSKLAFGCGGIGGALNYAESRELLLAAWEIGIRHFDVAPSYGFGAAEPVLGRFIKEVGASDCTVTTKGGIKPAQVPGLGSPLHSVSRRLLSVTPKLRKIIGNLLRKRNQRSNFSVPEIERSLHNSLRSLGRDHIEIFLMHEITVDEVNQELLRFLEDAKREGKIGVAGIGSRREVALALLPTLPEALEVIQTDWSFETIPTKKEASPFWCNYGVLRHVDSLADSLQQNPELMAQLTEIMGVKTLGTQDFADLLLCMALSEPELGLIIVQSARVSRVSAFAVDERIANMEAVGKLLRTTIGSLR